MTDEVVSAFSYLLVPADLEKAKADRRKLAELVRQHGFRALRYEERPEDVRTRPRLSALLARAQARECSVMLVLRLNDVAMTRVGVGKVVHELYGSGVRVIAATGIELDPKVARWLASEESARRRKIKSALDQKRDAGECTGEIPYGWRLDDDGVHLVEDRYEQWILTEARQLAAGGATPSDIARRLAERGWENRAGNAHGRGAIRRWLLRGW